MCVCVCGVGVVWYVVAVPAIIPTFSPRYSVVIMVRVAMYLLKYTNFYMWRSTKMNNKKKFTTKNQSIFPHTHLCGKGFYFIFFLFRWTPQVIIIRISGHFTIHLQCLCPYLWVLCVVVCVCVLRPKIQDTSAPTHEIVKFSILRFENKKICWLWMDFSVGVCVYVSVICVLHFNFIWLEGGGVNCLAAITIPKIYLFCSFVLFHLLYFKLACFVSSSFSFFLLLHQCPFFTISSTSSIFFSSACL